MADPFFALKAEVESSLLSLATLLASYLRLTRSSPSTSLSTSSRTNEELSYALSELRATLSALVNDLEELEESVGAVEEPGIARRLGVSSGEVKERRAFVGRVQKEIQKTREAMGRDASPSLAERKRFSGGILDGPSSYAAGRPYEPPDVATPTGTEPMSEFEMQHETLLMEQQDRTLTDISGTVGMLREQARVMGREVVDQNAMLEDLETHVDSTSSRLEKAQRRMTHFIRQNQNSPSSWCIFILMIILSFLLVIILFF